MYAGVACFWADRLELARVSLRRYMRGGAPCTGAFSCHNGHSPEIAQVPLIWKDEGWMRHWTIEEFAEPEHDDPRWPTHCVDCGYAFGPDDEWQVFSDMLYRRLDTGEELILAGANGSRGSGPPGMLFEMNWYPRSRPGPDGIALGAVCPNGTIWCVDGPASNGDGGWTRTGEVRATPPTVTASPSIVAGDYHGWLQNGRFTDG